MTNLTIHNPSQTGDQGDGRAASYVHIGMPKTATTTIQNNIFFKHSEVVYLGKRSELPKIPDRETTAFYHWLSKSPSSMPQQVLSEYRETINQRRQQGKTVILSKEALTAAPIEKKKHQARRLHELFGDTRILLTTREPVSFMESFYFQQLRGYQQRPQEHQHIASRFGRPPRFFGFNDWLDIAWSLSMGGILNHLKLADTLDVYANEFGRENILIVPFEKIKQDSDQFYRTISEHIGIDADESIALSKQDLPRNIRWTAGVFERLERICNSRYGRWKFRLFGQKQRLSDYLGKHMETALDGAKRAHAEISEQSRDRILSVSRPQCDRLVREWNVPLAEYGYPLSSGEGQVARAA